MQTRSRRLSSASGFSLLEALVAIFITLIVMASVFGFLAGGARTSTVEMDRVDLQAQTRHALNQISRDVMLAGYGLPPEFPSFGSDPSVSGTGNPSASQRLEILGMAADALGAEPIEMESFDGRTARLAELPPSLVLGQPVLVYDDLPVDGSWVLGLVSGIRTEPVFEVEMVTAAGTTVTTPTGTVSLPADVDRYNRTPNGPPESGYLTPVSIVSYEISSGSADANEDTLPTLMRQLNWGERIHVAHLESMEIRYFVGGTLSGPVIQTAPRRGKLQFRKVGDSNSTNRQPPPSSDPGFESELRVPPVPQPNPRLALDENDVVRAVRISLTGRSRHKNLVGSRVERDESPEATGYVRQTLSTRVATRNLMSRAELRRIQLESDSSKR